MNSGAPLAEIARDLGIKYETLKRHLKRLNVPYATNQHRTGHPHYESRVSAMYYIENNLPISAPTLRKKLIEEGIKEKKCERCGITEWMGQDVPLELHHLDENHHNNKLENLVILCSNCHAQLHGYGNSDDVRAVEHKAKVKNEPKRVTRRRTKSIKKYCVVCGKELHDGQKKYCSRECLYHNTGKAPEKEKLAELFETNMSFVEIGKLYGVSEAAVRKWKKKYSL